jgi:FKBP-type peptidyl-prolyl cis-trans isomerase
MKKLFALLLTLTLIYSCSKEKPFIPLESGLSYRIIEDRGGRKAGQEDLMILELKSVYKDSIVAEPKPAGGFRLNPYQDAPPMLRDVLILLGEGDSAHIKFSLEQYFTLTNMRVATNFDTTESVYMQVRVTEVNERQVIMDRLQAEAKREVELLLEKEKETIEAYLVENSLEAQQTPEGVYYVVTKEGKGPKAKTGELAKIDYVLTLLDGTYIDTSKKAVAEANNIYDTRREPYLPYEFVVGDGTVIKGWDLAIPLLSKGSTAKVFLPSSLAFGANPRPGPITPNAIVMFEVEVIDVKSN